MPLADLVFPSVIRFAENWVDPALFSSKERGHWRSEKDVLRGQEFGLSRMSFITANKQLSNS